MNLLLENGKIYTMDENLPYAEKMFVRGDKIVSLGQQEEDLVKGVPDVTRIDLDGNAVIPGFNDSHLHMLNYGITLSTVDLTKVASYNELIYEAKNYIEKNNVAEGTWVLGRGLNEDIMKEQEFPNREILDQISQKHPILFQRKCCHVSGLNSLGLEKAGITAEDNGRFNGGEVYLDSSGRPTGILAEEAQKLGLKAIPSPSEKDLQTYIKLAANHFVRSGLTSVQTDDIKAITSGEDKIMNAYFALAEKGELPLKVNLQLQLTSEKEITDFVDKYNHIKKDNNLKNLSMGPIKVLLDGSLGGKTAALREPYEGDKENRGILTFTSEKLYSLLDCASKHNFQIACHAIGDAAIELFLDTIEKIQKKYGGDYRHRIIHCQLTDKDLINRIAKNNLLVDVQPVFVSSDHGIIEKRLGFKRSVNTYAWKSMLDRGIMVSASSDCPVEDFPPLPGVKAAVLREDNEGNPKGGWHPWEKTTVFDALKMYTLNPAYATFEEHVKGKIAPGYYADLTVLSEDPFKIPQHDIDKIKVEKILVNGQLTESNK